MNLRNYTSTVPAERSISQIEARLAAAGASGIMKLYGPDKRPSSLVFELDLGNGHAPVKIRVPANQEACFQAMWKQHCMTHRQPRESTKESLQDQATRTAWKIVADWVDIQISMIVMKQVEFLEVFLPYVWDGKQTFFEAVRGGGFKMLAEKNQ
jgi:hypothetical protein